jgi:hypothetical protein
MLIRVEDCHNVETDAAAQEERELIEDSQKNYSEKNMTRRRRNFPRTADEMRFKIVLRCSKNIKDE